MQKTKPATNAAAKKAAPKATRQAAPKPAAVEAKVKHKLVRDSFTIPKTEHVVLESLKQRAADLKRPTKGASFQGSTSTCKTTASERS